MRLFVLRHAKTEQKSHSGKDVDRDLKMKGLRQLERMGDFFISNFNDVEFRVFCSNSTRTRNTLRELESILSIKELTFHDDLYLASRNQLLDFLEKQSDESENILLIGHNFGLSDLCTYISGETTLLPTCGLIVYDFTEFSNSNEISRETGVEQFRYFPKV